MNNSNISRRGFVQRTAATSLGIIAAPTIVNASDKSVKHNSSLQTKEWRNKQSGMVYRKLGRTGMMVSEMVMGTFPYNDPNFLPIVEAAIEKGINYLDSAAAYSKGQVEKVLGTYLKQPSNREKVFLATKLSGYYGAVDRFIREALKDISESKKEALHKKALQMVEERSVLKPGYHINYFGAQEAQFEKTYFRYLALKEYGYQKKWKQKIKDHAFKLVNDSLSRLQTDYIDVLFMPHGLAMPEMLDDEILQEVFAELKQKGMIKASAVSFHNDVSANLNKAIDVGYYDVAMFAYNIGNHAALESLIYKGKEANMGLIAMKLARKFAMSDSPSWMEDKLNDAIPDNSISKYTKAYLWGLQNQNISAVNSQVENLEQLNENLSIVGKKVPLTKV